MMVVVGGWDERKRKNNNKIASDGFKMSGVIWSLSWFSDQ